MARQANIPGSIHSILTPVDMGKGIVRSFFRIFGQDKGCVIPVIILTVCLFLDQSLVAQPAYAGAKTLYPTEPGQGLDWVDPVATGDTTTATIEESK